VAGTVAWEKDTQPASSVQVKLTGNGFLPPAAPLLCEHAVSRLVSLRARYEIGR